MNDHLMNAVAALDDKYAEAAGLRAKLDLSLALAKVEPRAFSHGSCTTKVVGNIQHRLGEAKFIVALGNDEEITHRLLDVPFELWGSGAQAEYKSIPQYRRKLVDKSLKRITS